MAKPLIGEVSFSSLCPYDTALSAPTICTDRLEYWRDDPTGHVVATFPKGPVLWNLRIELHRDIDHGPIESKIGASTDPAQRKVSILLQMGALAFGQYELRLALVDSVSGEDAEVVRAAFTKIDQAESQTPIPAEGIPIEVDPQSHLPNGSWPVETGVPLPRGVVHGVGELELVEDGAAIPATLEERGRWQPGGSLKWLGLAFVARWNGTAPRSYRLRRVDGGAPPEGALRVRNKAGPNVVVDTGALRFTVNRQAFAGVKLAGTTTAGLRAPSAGPYVVDERGTFYESWRAEPDNFHIEGDSTRVRIVIAGWYAAADGRKLCRYHTQIRASAGSAQVHITHRTIVTFDPAQTRLADIGWRIPVNATRSWRTAMDGVVVSDSGMAGESIGIHQDRPDHCRIIEDGSAGVIETLAGTRADGWFSADGWLNVDGAEMSVTVVLREMVEQFPKEVELACDGTASSLALHFWPRHGHQAFTSKSVPRDPSRDALDRTNIHKLWYAHEGQLLDLAFPSAYVAELQALRTGQLVAGENPIEESAISSAASGAAIGTAIGNDFMIMHHPTALGDAERMAFARLFQDEPGALAAPAWNASTGVEGRWAPRDEVRFPQAERLLDTALPGFHHAIVDVPRQYGMWIYGGMHDLWLPSIDAPQLHRVWQVSHYRNVWLAWFLYLRSRLPALRRWARVASDRFLHTGTVHHVDPNVRRGKHMGDMYHCYAFTPWGGESDVWGHYVDPDAHRLRFLLTGDRFAEAAYESWWESLRGIPAIPAGGGNREAVQTLGVLVDRYAQKGDASALELVWRFADQLFTHYRDEATGQYRVRDRSVNPSDHPVWHRQWPMLYYDMTRDRRVVELVRAWIDEGYGDLSPNAFAAHATGDDQLVRKLVPRFLDQCLHVHDDPADRYHGYGPATAGASRSYLLQQAAYFLGALRDAGISVLDHGERAMAYPAVRWGNVNTSFWSVRVYAIIPANAGSAAVTLRSLLGYGAVGGGADSPVTVSRWDNSSLAWITAATGTLPGGEAPSAVSIALPQRAADWLCRVDIHSADARVFAPITPFPEIAMLRKVGGNWLEGSYGVARQDWWFASLGAQPATLEIEAVRGFYDLPAFVAIEESSSGFLSGRTIFAHAQKNDGTPLPDQRSVTVHLEPPGPWHVYTAATGGPILRLPGIATNPDCLFLGRSRSDLEALLPRLAPSGLGAVDLS